MRTGTKVLLGVLVVGGLAAAGFAYTAYDETLRSVPSESRKAMLVQIARMRPLNVVSALPGSISGRTKTAEARPTTPTAWGDSILSWIEQMNNDGYAIAYWEAGEADHLTVAAFLPNEEPELAKHPFRMDSPGWLMLLKPHEYATLMKDENREDILKGIVRGPALAGDTPYVRDLSSPGVETYDTKSEIPNVVKWWLDWSANGKYLNDIPKKGRRYMAQAVYTLPDGTDERAIVEGYYQGPEGLEGGKLLVDRIVSIQKDAYHKGEMVPPRAQLYTVPATTSKGVNQSYLQQPTWDTMHPTAVSFKAFATPALAPVGSRVIFPVRETNPWGNAVLVVDGTVLPADEDTPVGSVKVSTGDFIKKVRGGDDTALPQVAYVPLENLVDPASIGA